MTKSIKLIALFCVVLVQSVSAQVTIPDANLRMALKAAHPNCFDTLDVMDTTCVASIQSLSIAGQNVSNSEGLQYFKGLTSLDCNYNFDLACLPILPAGLTTLNIEGTSINCIANVPAGIAATNTFPLCHFSTGCAYLPANSGLVTLPDTAFSSFLKIHFPACFTSENQLDTLCAANASPVGLAADIEIDGALSTSPITNLDGLQYFKGMHSWYIASTEATSLPKLPSEILYIDCSDNPITNIPVLPEGLIRFGCRNSLISTVPPLPSSLKTLELDNNPLSSFSALPAGLEWFSCGSSSLSSLPALPPNLKHLDARENNFTSLPTLPANLEVIDISGNQIQEVQSLPSGLKELYIMTNQISQLPTLPSGLERLECQHNQLASLPTLPSTLSHLACGGNLLTSLPFLPSNLTFLECSDMLTLSCLPVLPSTLTTLGIYGSDNIRCLPNAPAGLLPGITPFPPLCTPTFDPNQCMFPVITSGVTIPDANFRNALKVKYPTCFNASNQLDTVCAGNATATQLDVSSKQIANLEGVRYFKKLTRLYCDSNQLTSLPTLPSGLIELSCYSNQLTSLPTLPNGLTRLYCAFNQLTSLPTLPNGLIRLECYFNQLTSLPTLPNGFKELNCYYNQLTSLPALPSGLTELSCSYNQLTSLPTLPSSLTNLNCTGNNLTSLSTLPSGLITLHCGTNQLISLPTLPDSLMYLYCFSNPQLSCLPFLPSTLELLYVTGSNINCLPNKPVGLTSSLPLCNPTNNTNECRVFPLITGYVFHDVNNNGVKDAGEMPRIGVKVHIPSKGFAGYTNENGFYEITVDSLKTYTASIAQVPMYYTSASPSQSVTFTAYGETVERNFPLQTTQTVKDFQVHLTNLNAFARPGFGLNLHLGYQNKGTVTANAVIKFAKADLYDVASSSIAHTLSGDTLVWTIPNVQVGQFGYIQIQGTLSASATLGSVQNFYASVNQNDATDNMIADNSSLLQMQVRGSYDPNDKQGPATITPTQVANGQFIDYTIRFQNTGTDTAFTVVIADTLANNLQANTLEMIAASHSVNTELKGNIIYFKFNNILLPDSNTNESRSHGFVSFRIKPKTNLTLGNKIQNKAAIYFDFNAPIITNTVTTTVAIPTGIAEKVSRRLEVYPNPLEGEVLTVPNMRGASAKLLSLEGKELRTWSNIGEQISLQNVASGMYLLEVLHEGQRRVAKVVVK